MLNLRDHKKMHAMMKIKALGIKKLKIPKPNRQNGQHGFIGS